MNIKNKQACLAAVLLSLGLAANSYGYIDMNTGSYVLQLAVAGVLGSLYTLRGYAKVIMTKFARLIGLLVKKRP